MRRSRRADLRQRRLHHLRQRPSARSAGWVDRAGLPMGQDEDRHRSGSRSAARRRGSATRSATPACSSTPTAPCRAGRRWTSPNAASTRGALVRGAGVQRRSGRAALAARPDAGPMEIAAGEYAYNLDDFRRMLEAGAVDVQQADVTRCGGVTGFLAAGAVRGPSHRSVRPLRAVAALPRRLRGAAAAPPRMVPRSCADRAHAVRRRCRGPRRHDRAGPEPARPGPDAEGGRRGPSR